MGVILKVLPLIYSDNCVSTQGVHQIKRNYVVDPTVYGLSESSLGWQRKGDKEFVIPAERPQLYVIPENGTIKFKIEPKVNGKNEYHIEYSVMSAFGKLYSNWVALYLPISSAKEFIQKVTAHYQHVYRDIKGPINLRIKTKAKRTNALDPGRSNVLLFFTCRI